MMLEQYLVYLKKEANWKIAKIELTSFRNMLLLFTALTVVFLVILYNIKNVMLINWFGACFWSTLFILPFYIISKIKERKAYKELQNIN